MKLEDLKKQFEVVRQSQNFREIRNFMWSLTENDAPRQAIIDRHYYFIQQKNVSEKLYHEICKWFAFNWHDGREEFMLQKVKSEKDPHLKGILLQMLGTGKYHGGKHLKEIAVLARTFARSKDAFMRGRGVIVLGWIGDPSDIPLLQKVLVHEKEDLVRGYAATAFLQLFLNNKQVEKHPDRLLKILFRALMTEQGGALGDILITIQEISGKKLGLRSQSYRIASESMLAKAKKKRLLYLQERELKIFRFGHRD